ncbi:MAG: hypothetical protein WD825_07550 [Gemmatimonadaceae bacterium]
MKLSAALTIGLVALALPRAVDAQGRGTESRKKEIPASSRPPAGMCRVWLDDVPAAQQPAPTDCATAVRNRPAKGRVIFGDDYAAPKRDSSVKGKGAIKGFAPSKPGDKKPVVRRPPLVLP